MKQTKDFAEGVAYTLQAIRDFETKHGHLHVDALAACSLCEFMRDYAIVFRHKRFEVVKRDSPFSETYIVL
ncbi:MAG: hypothetical protein JSS93_04215 [Bacteroidetes bacterium]|nr:hypothetical protein [Bacteroidota bacterium]MBS1981706.1 hypothetical protein [Bacteroidota bacterium]